MEFSFVIPCTPKSYSKDKILRIFNTLSVNIKKFDMILCTSKNNIGIQRSNIMLMNKDIKIRAYCSVNDASPQGVLREGVKHCQYNTVVILDLDKFTDESIADLSSLEDIVSNKRFVTYISENSSIFIARTYDFSLVLNSTSKYDLKSIINLFDYTKFELLEFSSKSIYRKSFEEYIGSERQVKRLLRQRKSKKINESLCDYFHN